MKIIGLCGGSGSGKSKYVCDRILHESNKNPKKNYFVIVPDQFTMQTQFDLVDASKEKGIRNIDVLSFGRLTHRIFEETLERLTQNDDKTAERCYCPGPYTLPSPWTLCGASPWSPSKPRYRSIRPGTPEVLHILWGSICGHDHSV